MTSIKNGRTGIECAYCGKEFKKQTSVRRRQVVWVRMTLRIHNQLFQLHGSVCARCRDKAANFQVAELQGA